MNNKELFENRKQFLESLTSLINEMDGSESSKVIAIDAGWGFGKTFFKDELSSKLKAENTVLEFNAWEYDIEPNALFAVNDAILAQMASEETTSKVTRHYVALLGSLMCLSPKIAQVYESIKNVGNRTEEIESYMATNNNLSKMSEMNLLKENIKNFCKEYIGENKTKIVVLVDELDRCRPNFSIEVLETLKHLFDISNFTFVFFINKTELKKSISYIFGNINTDIYLRRFFDITFKLPEPDFIKYSSEEEIMSNEYLSGVYKLVSAFANDSDGHISLRDVNQIFDYMHIFINFKKDIVEKSFLFYVPILIIAKIYAPKYFEAVFCKKQLNYVANDDEKWFTSLLAKIVIVKDSSDASEEALLQHLFDPVNMYQSVRNIIYIFDKSTSISLLNKECRSFPFFSINDERVCELIHSINQMEI